MTYNPEMEKQNTPEAGEVTRTQLACAVDRLRQFEETPEDVQLIAEADLDIDVARDLIRRSDASNPLPVQKILDEMILKRGQERFKFGDAKPELKELKGNTPDQGEIHPEELQLGAVLQLKAEVGAQVDFKFGIKHSKDGRGYILFGIAPFANDEIKNFTRFIEIPQNGDEEQTFTFGKEGDYTMPDVNYSKGVSRKHFSIKVDSEGRVCIKDLGSTNGTKLGIIQGIEVKSFDTSGQVTESYVR